MSDRPQETVILHHMHRGYRIFNRNPVLVKLVRQFDAGLITVSDLKMILKEDE